MRFALPLAVLAICACTADSTLTQVKDEAAGFVRASSGVTKDIPGTLRDTVELGKKTASDAAAAFQNVKAKVDTAKQGIETVKNGYNSIKEGQQMIEKAVGAQTSST